MRVKVTKHTSDWIHPSFEAEIRHRQNSKKAIGGDMKRTNVLQRWIKKVYLWLLQTEYLVTTQWHSLQQNQFFVLERIFNMCHTQKRLCSGVTYSRFLRFNFLSYHPWLPNGKSGMFQSSDMAITMMTLAFFESCFSDQGSHMLALW